MKGQTLLLAFTAASASARKCHNISTSVDLTARNAVFNLTAPSTTIDTINFFLNSARQGHNYTNEVLAGYATITGTYQIAATFCTPDRGPAPTTVQLLTHGVTLARSYWDIPLNNHNYSYVASAVDTYGYATLAWDLLGVGGSQRGDPVNELQSNLQNAALYALTQKLRGGGGGGGFGAGVPVFKKVVHVGHSYGSIQTYTLGVRHPEASDGLVLTGFSHSTVGFPAFLAGGDFGAANARPQLADYAAGFWTPSGEPGVQTVFFGPGDFDPAVLRYTFETAAAASVGEILTLGADTGVVSSFAGPVLVITGDRDLGFCGGDCLITGNASLPSLLDLTKSFVPKASPFQSFVVPNSGHLLNSEYTHPLTYKTILDFVSQHVKP